MTRARIINAIAWAIIAVTICIAVVIEWRHQGCPIKSLVIGCAMYTAMAAGIGATIDQTIKEKQL
jgi:tryptophan-rich sensory protein